MFKYIVFVVGPDLAKKVLCLSFMSYMYGRLKIIIFKNVVWDWGNLNTRM